MAYKLACGNITRRGVDSSALQTRRVHTFTVSDIGPAKEDNDALTSCGQVILLKHIATASQFCSCIQIAAAGNQSACMCRFSR